MQEASDSMQPANVNDFATPADGETVTLGVCYHSRLDCEYNVTLELAALSTGHGWLLALMWAP